MMRSGMAMARCQRAEAARTAAQALWRPLARSHHAGVVSVGSDRYRQHRAPPPPPPPLGIRGVGAARWLTTGVDDNKEKATPSIRFPGRSLLAPRRSFATTPPTDGEEEKVAEAVVEAAVEPEPVKVVEKSMFPAFMG